MASSGPVVFVYQRMLPYHQARFAAVAEELRKLGGLGLNPQLGRSAAAHARK